MKNKKAIIFLIVSLSLLSIALIIFMFMIIKGKFRMFNYSYKLEKNIVINEIYNNDFSKINIRSDASEIEVLKSDDDNFKVLIYGDSKKAKVNTNNDILDIDYKTKKCSFFCFNIKISKIEVYIPSAYDKDIFIKNNYGDIKVDKFKNISLDIEENYGDIKIKSVNKVNVKNDYGDVNIGNAHDITVKESYGDVKIGNVYNTNIKNNYGDINISKVNNYMNLKIDCGDINIDNINLKKNSTIKNDLGDVRIGSTNKIYIDAKNDLGDIKINHNYNKSDVTLKIKNDVGDIRVKN